MAWLKRFKVIASLCAENRYTLCNQLPYFIKHFNRNIRLFRWAVITLRPIFVAADTALLTLFMEEKHDSAAFGLGRYSMALSSVAGIIWSTHHDFSARVDVALHSSFDELCERPEHM